MKGSIACRLLLALLSLGVPCKVMAQLWDDFSDGDFSNGVLWRGDTVQFVVSNGVLQLNSTGSDSSFISALLPQQGDTLEWRFKLKLPFSPSSQNYARFYLVSGSDSLEGPVQAYFLQFGESGAADAIVLCRQDGWTLTPLLRAGDSLVANSFDLRARVLRLPGGTWQLEADYSGAENFIQEGSVNDTVFPPSGYTGIKFVYTSGNANDFYLDDVYAGAVLRDTLPLQVQGAGLVSDSTVEVFFSEQPDSSAVMQVQHYVVNGIGYPNWVEEDVVQPFRYLLYFPPVFDSSGIFSLIVSGIGDMNGNLLQDSARFMLFHPAHAETSDVLFSEVMADPVSAPSLPPYEYFELYNRSHKVIVMNGWSIADPASTGLLPDDTLFPGDYRCYTDPAGLSSFLGEGIPAKAVSGFPSLNNDADQLSLLDGSGVVIDVLRYHSSMYRDPLRDDRGWSLERIDKDFPCHDELNWSASLDPSGGTPGRQNAVEGAFTDTLAPWPVSAFPIDSLHLEIVFSEFLDSMQALPTALFEVIPDIGHPTAIRFSTGMPSCTLTLALPLIALTNYQVDLDMSLRDCAGNPLSRWSHLPFALPDSIRPGDLQISEVLFNPVEEGSDFVEIYHAGKHGVDLSQLRIGHADVLTGSTDDVMPFSVHQRLLFPGQYAVVSTRAMDIVQRYRVMDRRMLIESDLPSFNDDEGVVVLLTASLQELERFHYKDDFHFPLLDDPEGVSLERISPLRPAGDSSNWHSASSSCGFATPTAQNSQYDDYSNTSGKWLDVSPELFSPDNDGYHDVLGIRCRPSRSGFVAALSVYDENGVPVRRLSRQELIGAEGIWYWNGLNDEGQKVPAGIYVVLAELFHIDGETRVLKKACVLAERF
ncbi:MAG: lamin tail domain-containing protein [Bacteroidia bacterium]|nr:lamin tail domain-containing protein [Bacteroidia bacterium]